MHYTVVQVLITTTINTEAIHSIVPINAQLLSLQNGYTPLIACLISLNELSKIHYNFSILSNHYYMSLLW